MRFHAYKAQIRFMAAAPVDYVLEEVGAASERRPSKKQLLSVNPALHIIDVVTDRGPLELGVQAHQVEDVRARLAAEGGAASSVQDV